MQTHFSGAVIDVRLCFWGSVFYTAKMLMNSSDDADLTAEERSEAGHTFQGTEGEAEAKSEAAIESPTSEVPPSVETEAKPGVTAGVTA